MPRAPTTEHGADGSEPRPDRVGRLPALVLRLELCETAGQLVALARRLVHELLGLGELFAEREERAREKERRQAVSALRKQLAEAERRVHEATKKRDELAERLEELEVDAG